MMSTVAAALLSLQLAAGGPVAPAPDQAAVRDTTVAPAPMVAAPARVAAAPAATVTAAAAPPAAATPADVPADWARAPNAPAASAAAIRAAVNETIAAERAAEREALPTYRFSSAPPPDRYQVFADQFDDARVPDCLHADGLKRQSTLIFGGLLALPFVAIAKLRGKCN